MKQNVILPAGIQNDDNDPQYMFYCKGCNTFHWLTTDDDLVHFNGDLSSPTITPNLVNDGFYHCDLSITDGVITYSDDSTHQLAGKSVVMGDQ